MMFDLDREMAEGFIWATGIENTFVPQTRAGMRSLDEYELTQHYEFWRSDFDLVAETGVQALRWGIPWYRVQPKPKLWDWRWTDEALDYLVNVKRIAPILDLMHYGTPLWLDNSFINASYPQRVAEYAAAVAERYGSLVKIYTPLNEPTINAHMAGRRGQWPPYLHGEDGYYRVLVALARGMVLTTQALLAVQPDAKTVQVEAVGYRWAKDPRLAQRVAAENAAQFLAFDLSTGRVDEQPLPLPLSARAWRHRTRPRLVPAQRRHVRRARRQLLPLVLQPHGRTPREDPLPAPSSRPAPRSARSCAWSTTTARCPSWSPRPPLTMTWWAGSSGWTTRSTPCAPCAAKACPSSATPGSRCSASIQLGLPPERTPARRLPDAPGAV